MEDDVSLYPKKNFTDVVPDEFARKYDQTGMDYDVLLLQASSTDITNIDTTKPGRMEYFKQCAVISSENMFNVAVNAVNNTDVSKVIIMERIPRLDRVNDDPSL